MQKGNLLLIVALFLAVFLVSPAYPQGYPDKPVSVIVAYAAGGETDIGARIVASIAEKDLGQSIVVVNKGGAGGQLGWTDLARQKHGYTIGFVGTPALNSIILDPERKPAFTLDHFVPIINQVVDPVCFYVKPESPYKSFKDLLEDARKRPSKITVTTKGMLSNEHLGILLLEDATKVKFRIVHFDGSAQINTALMGGGVDVGVDNVGGPWTSRVKGGQVRALIVMDKERSKFYPNVPTTVEQGYPCRHYVFQPGDRGSQGHSRYHPEKTPGGFQEGHGRPAAHGKNGQGGTGRQNHGGRGIRQLHK